MWLTWFVEGRVGFGVEDDGYGGACTGWTSSESGREPHGAAPRHPAVGQGGDAVRSADAAYLLLPTFSAGLDPMSGACHCCCAGTKSRRRIGKGCWREPRAGCRDSSLPRARARTLSVRCLRVGPATLIGGIKIRSTVDWLATRDPRPAKSCPAASATLPAGIAAGLEPGGALQLASHHSPGEANR